MKNYNLHHFIEELVIRFIFQNTMLPIAVVPITYWKLRISSQIDMNVLGFCDSKEKVERSFYAIYYFQV